MVEAEHEHARIGTNFVRSKFLRSSGGKQGVCESGKSTEKAVNKTRAANKVARVDNRAARVSRRRKLGVRADSKVVRADKAASKSE